MLVHCVVRLPWRLVPVFQVRLEVVVVEADEEEVPAVVVSSGVSLEALLSGRGSLNRCTNSESFCEYRRCGRE